MTKATCKPEFVDKNENFHEVRAITLWQPWASLVAVGLKRFETRGWSTGYKGKLLIHAAKKPMDNDGRFIWEEAHKLRGIGAPDIQLLPLGKIVAICDSTNCAQMVEREPSSDYGLEKWYIAIGQQSRLERLCGDWRQFRFAWKLDNVQALDEPIPAKGRQQLWYPEQELVDKIFGRQTVHFQVVSAKNLRG